MVDETIERAWRIYKITCLSTGKSYIGMTVDTIRQRWSNHVCQATRSASPMLLHRAIRKYGRPNFSLIELSIHSSRHDASTAERHAIMKHGTLRPNGYNLADGGMGTPGVRKPHSIETRLKIGLAQKGKIITLEARARIACANKSRKITEATRAKIGQISKSIPREHFIRMARARRGVKVHIRTIRLLRAAIGRVDNGTSKNFRMEHSKFSTRIGIGAEKKHLGMFPTKEAALSAFREAAVVRLQQLIEMAKDLYGEGHPLWKEIVSHQYDCPSENSRLLFQPAPQQPTSEP